jgi:hypothetical protein
VVIKLEYCDGSSWQPLASEVYVNTTIPNLAVTSVAITGSPGLSVTGSPITGIGTIGLTLNLELQSLANLSATGLMTRTGTATYVGRSLVAGYGISVTNANGLAGNPTIAVSTIDLNNNTTGQLTLSRLNGYPSNSLYFLNGNGAWVNPLTMTTNDLDNLSSGITIKNTNPAATAAGLTVDSNITGTGVQFGFNNNTSEAYVWASGSASLKFATNATKRMELLNNGSLNMLNNSIINCANPINPQDVSNKTYIDTKVFDISNNTSGQLSSTRLSGYPNNSNFFLKGNGTWNYLASNGSYNLISGTGAFSDHVLLVNLEGKFGSGKYNAVCYGSSGQAAVEFFYGGVLKSYINPSGVLISASNAKLKDSMRKKDIFKKDYLERILNLDVYSYTWKSTDSAKHASNHVAVGPLYGDVARLFNGNALSHPKAREGFVCSLKNCPQCHPDFKGINLAEILSYLILAFQSFYYKEYLPLKNTIIPK